MFRENSGKPKMGFVGFRDDKRTGSVFVDPVDDPRTKPTADPGESWNLRSVRTVPECAAMEEQGMDKCPGLLRL
jgi:hypothetical protein